MIPNAWRGFDFALGEDVDALRDTVARFSAGEIAPRADEIDRQNEFQMQPGDTVAGILAQYEKVAARTEEIVAALPDLSATQPLPAAPWNEPGAAHSARRVLIHVIAETTQHAGHADIIRETIDGQTST